MTSYRKSSSELNQPCYIEKEKMVLQVGETEVDIYITFLQEAVLFLKKDLNSHL